MYNDPYDHPEKRLQFKSIKMFNHHAVNQLKCHKWKCTRSLASKSPSPYFRNQLCQVKVSKNLVLSEDPTSSSAS
ncbi:hypothetical protein AMATHDRAFT_68297 [Amanita thiersii Skay4041]|uniref:Uncharacterized protein n=1 Tax=Amanita thiersii Skay4041 TaxID=703135 RepID=A0A2A9NHI2_9AGAR|nr:hypothetical protein AMATHDRAFT_68297 [Amanita thiersii Skay4041]